MPVGTRSAIDVVLEEDALMVDDVVVIGYGTQSRRTITAAVSKVDGEKLAGAPVNSIGDALKGRVGGVRVSSADNQPGSDPVFLIRGGSSINQSNAPIIIIDGVNREMTGLNPNDIESIEVLKDARFGGYLRCPRLERRNPHHDQEGQYGTGPAGDIRGAGRMDFARREVRPDGRRRPPAHDAQ